MKRKILTLLTALVLLASFEKNTQVADAKNITETQVTLESAGELESVSYSVATEKKIKSVLVNALEEVKTKVDFSSYGISYEGFEEVYRETVDSNHRYFYVNGCSYSATNGKLAEVNIRYTANKSTIKKMLQEYDAAMALAVNEVADDWSDMEKALYLNDYLSQNCTYDFTYTGRTAYDALVKKAVVCEGYAQAYKALLAEVGIRSEIVSSQSLNHAWNLVEINGKYYHVDVTWNDSRGETLGSARHAYFMKSTEYFKKDHYVADDWKITGDWKLSSAKDTAYDNCVWNDIDTGFSYANGYWYAFDGNNIVKYQCDGKKFTAVGTEIEINDVWHVVGVEEGQFGYWYDKYTGLGSCNGFLYYSNENTIYKYDLEGKTSSVLYKLTPEQEKTGRIFGLQINVDGTINYYFNDTPVSGGKVYTLPQKLNTVAKYTIVFKGNGATDGIVNKLTKCKYGTTYKLPVNTFKRSGYVFNGWNTKANGKGKAYKNKASVKNLAKDNGKIVTLYAQWKKVGINTTKKTLKVGASYTLKLTGTTIKSTSSSNRKIATVNKKGKVVAKKAGKATIKLKAKNGKTYKCQITVKK